MDERDREPSGPRLLMAFVNTEEIDKGRDALADPEAAGRWLADAGLPCGVDEAGLERLRVLREGLRRLLEAHESSAGTAEGWGMVARAASGVTLALSFEWSDRDDLRLGPAGDGAVATIGALLGLIYDEIRIGRWRRLKACRSETCRWAFYDSSKNGSAAWCSMAVCGNRAKARRRRRKVAGGNVPH